MEDTARNLAREIWKNIVADDDIIIDKKTGEIVGPEFDYTCYRDTF